ncbi:hypothetical protein N657DRAFT_177711 [Parathielavia appendiculata]|uniref:Uncharacterized protein n=1 Tax=Parathielavia appendiculata TaxID=2587402 RepID=A0AAN6U6D5_9PEZI|nr:hypothetical protein N657DRAFT_177711 [Parathielavia appendiculata]
MFEICQDFASLFLPWVHFPPGWYKCRTSAPCLEICSFRSRGPASHRTRGAGSDAVSSSTSTRRPSTLLHFSQTKLPLSVISLYSCLSVFSSCISA